MILPLRLRRKIRIEQRSTRPVPGRCWIWVSGLTNRGYGRHREVYTIMVGPIPDGLEIDHLCEVKSCCNPRHLEPVTISENKRRALEASARHREAWKRLASESRPWEPRTA